MPANAGSMQVYQNILETIGDTPLVRLNWLSEESGAEIYGKLETFNPGHSIKDRMALKMLADAEAKELIYPGGTIIECTSGNTGMGLAIAASVKGYQCIFTTNDKQSKAKIDMLKAFGAEVIVCPTNVSPEDPRSYYSVAEKLSKQIPNSYWFNQYDNLSNTEAHYESTGPEIWQQTDGKITHLIVGVGTGGTISGTGQYLKEQNPDIKVWGIDTYGSVFKKYHETGIFDEKEIYPYITEGIGEDILPKNVNFEIIDYFEKVSDKDAALAARKLAKKEGLLMGYSAGSAVAGLLQLKDRLKQDDLVVIIFHDHGSRYVEKIYNDLWMRERGFMESPSTIADLISAKVDQSFVAVSPGTSLTEVAKIMKSKEISQIPVIEDDKVIGSITESIIINQLMQNNNGADMAVKECMTDPFPILDFDTKCKDLQKHINRKNPAILTIDHKQNMHIITQYDLLQILSA